MNFVQKRKLRRNVITMKFCKVFVVLLTIVAILLIPITASAALYQKGMESNEIMKLQNDLASLGFFDVEATGFYGEITYTSVYEFQKEHNLYLDGIAGNQTLTKIAELLHNVIVDDDRGKNLLYEGMTSEIVKLYQMKLIYLGLLNCEATGFYGILTKTAVATFQEGFGLKQDGIITEETASLINRMVQTKVTILRKYGELKMTNENPAVSTLQVLLTCMGYYNYEVTGYYGDITKRAVIAFQVAYGLHVDGMASIETLELIEKIIKEAGVVENSTMYQVDLLMNWFEEVQYVFAINDTAKVYDIWTGKSFYIMRTFGYNHADCETLTALDTAILKSLYGGEFNWDRRPVLIYTNGTIIAASLSGMPHAGRDDMPKDAWVPDRSVNYGTGANLDAIKGNDMDGVFDLHFYLSRTHFSNAIEPRHQDAVMQAYNYGISHLY